MAPGLSPRSWLFRVLLAFSLLLPVAPFAHAQELSEFEREMQVKVLESLKATIDEAPEGKFIESIEVWVVEPFDERDPIPDFVNFLHVNSLDYVVKQELALESNTRYDPRRADDSVQNLRATNEFSLVLLTTLRGSEAGRVRVLVIVKDIWSLRLNWDIEVINGRLNLLLLNPSEVNLFGTHATLGALFLLQPHRVTLGGRFYLPQVGGSNIGLYLNGGAILQRESLEPEGSYGYFQYFEPLKSRYDDWGWSVGMAWLDEVTRRYQGAEIRQLAVQDESGDILLIPEVYESDLLAGEYAVTRSYGVSNRWALSFGMEADRRRYRVPELQGVSASALEAFERVVVPTSDTRVSPFVQLRAHSASLHRLIDVETLSLQEDLRLGHDALLRLYPASEALASSRSLIGMHWALSYSVPLGSGLGRAKAGATLELAEQNQNDVVFDAGARVISPRAGGAGRLHLDALWLDRLRNYENIAPYALGGENRLRGYEYSLLQGDKVVSLNAEFRSVPWEVLGAHVGGVVFYDVGDAVDEYRDLEFEHSLGLGLRFLLPQFDRVPFRIDWGVPLSSEFGGLPGGVVATFGQAFSLPGVLEPSVLDGLSPD